MDNAKRQFLLKAFKLGWITAIYNLLPLEEAIAFMQMVGMPGIRFNKGIFRVG
jgi:hypothetical protein